MSMKMSAMQEALSEHLSQLHGQDKIINFAKECFQIFVGANFCGITGAIQTALPPTLQPEGYMDLAIQELSFGANKPAPVIRCADFLWVAKEIFFPEGSYLKSINFEQELWRLRVHQIWAAVLEEKSPELKKIIDFTLEQLEPLLKAESAAIPPPLVVQYHLEKAACELEYFERSKAQLSLEKAAEAAGVKLEMNREFGKRFHFQWKSVTQIALPTTPIEVSAADRSSSLSDQQEADNSDLPLNCKNSDDALIDPVNFDDKHLVGASTSLSDEQLACMLAIGVFESESVHSFVDGVEVPFVYVNKVIEQERNWAIQTRAFIERSSLEKQNTRKAKRACSQMELIVKLLNGIDEKPVNCKHHRLDMVYSTSPVPFWKAKKLEAEILSSLGCVSEAMKIYESLRMCEGVVACYNMLKQTEKAEQWVRELITQNESEKYYCILGDITSNPEYYLKAIQLSDDQSAQASASMGRLLMLQKHYPEATGYFKRSLELQPFQIGRWSNLGYCAMKVEEYNEATRAYHRCVSFEPENFEAWNNLAACYVKLNQRKKAQDVLMECLKLSYENFSVWESVMLVSVDLKDIPQALTAISKMLELDSNKSIDQLALKVISQMVMVSDEEGVVHWRKQLAGILEHLSSHQNLNSELVQLYAELVKPSAESIGSNSWSTYRQKLEEALQKSATELATKLIYESALGLPKTTVDNSTSMHASEGENAFALEDLQVALDELKRAGGKMATTNYGGELDLLARHETFIQETQQRLDVEVRKFNEKKVSLMDSIRKKTAQFKQLKPLSLPTTGSGQKFPPVKGIQPARYNRLQMGASTSSTPPKPGPFQRAGQESVKPSIKKLDLSIGNAVWKTKSKKESKKNLTGTK